MMARCAKCQQVFKTERYGRQFCPLCGAEVMLQPPGEAPPPAARPEEPSSPAPAEGGAPPPGGTVTPPPSNGGLGLPPAGPPSGRSTGGGSSPWERRGELGFFPALFETLKGSMTDPVKFFEQMRVDNADGAVTYYWLVAGVGAVAGQLWQALFALLKSGAASRMTSDNPMAAWVNSMANLPPLAHVGMGIAALVLAPVFLYIGAGIVHLSAMLFRSAGNGFNATLRAVAYAAGPSLLGIIPACGAFVGGIWSLVILVIAVWKLQRTRPGLAAGAVLLPIGLLFCCLCIGAVAIGVAAGSAFSHMQSMP